MAQQEVVHGVVVLAVDGVDANVAVLSHAELYERKTPKFRKDELLAQLFEPR